VILSGDSEFSPLVSKLREDNKVVIGVGVQSSTSDLLIANGDELINYDDLVRDVDQPRKGKRKAAATKPARAQALPPEERKKQEGLDLVLETVKDRLADG
jgi:hypothetical protein